MSMGFVRFFTHVQYCTQSVFVPCLRIFWAVCQVESVVAGAALCLLISLLSRPRAFADDAHVVVVGGTPGGVASAVAAARVGQFVILIEAHHGIHDD